MGVTVRQKTKGQGKPWWVFIAHDGKRASKKIGDKRAAEKVASEIRAKLKLGQFDLDKNRKAPLFKHCATGWIETTVPANCKETTASDYRALLDNHILDEFGDIQVWRELTMMKCVRFVPGQWEHTSGVSGIDSAQENAIVLHSQPVKNLFTEPDTFIKSVFVLSG